MSERSEFGLRAPVPEKRRAPARRSRAGSRPANGLFGSFLAGQKGTRTRQRAKALQLIHRSVLDSALNLNPIQSNPDPDPDPDPGIGIRIGIESARGVRCGARSASLPRTELPRCRAAYFCLAKSKQKRRRRTRSDAMKPHRAPALLGHRGTQPKLAALRHGLLFGPDALRCSARFTARKINGRQQQQSKAKQKRNAARIKATRSKAKRNARRPRDITRAALAAERYNGGDGDGDGSCNSWNQSLRAQATREADGKTTATTTVPYSPPNNPACIGNSSRSRNPPIPTPTSR